MVLSLHISRLGRGDTANGLLRRLVARRRCRPESRRYRFFDALNPDEFQLLASLLGNVLEVLPVPRRQHHALDAGPLRSHDLLLDAADREYESAQADLAGHGRVAAHGTIRQ